MVHIWSPGGHLVGARRAVPLRDDERLPGEGLMACYYKLCGASMSVDVNVIDGFVNYVGDATRRLGGSLRKLQTGKVSSYAYAFVLGAIVLLFILCYQF